MTGRKVIKESTLSSLYECDFEIKFFIKQINEDSTKMELMQASLQNILDSKSTVRARQPTLQEEVRKMTKTIPESDSLCLRTKNKLPYLSRRSILDNIGRLEMQLRTHNYRPREEELVLREISKLRLSLPVLEQYRTRLSENRYYRSERVRLVAERNANYDRLQGLLTQQTSVNDTLLRLQQSLERSTVALEDARNRKVKLMAIGSQQLLKRQQRNDANSVSASVAESQKTSPCVSTPTTSRNINESDDNRHHYPDELRTCYSLLQYLKVISNQSTSNATTPDPPMSSKSLSLQQPSTVESTPSPRVTCLIEPPQRPITLDISVPDVMASTACLNNPLISRDVVDAGTFYNKPEGEMAGSPAVGRANKRRRKNRSRKCIGHPPNVVTNFFDVNIALPKIYADIQTSIILLEDKIVQIKRQHPGLPTPMDTKANDTFMKNSQISHSSENTSSRSAFAHGSSSQFTSSFEDKIEQLQYNKAANNLFRENIFQSDSVYFGDSLESPLCVPKLYSDVAKSSRDPIHYKTAASINPAVYPVDEMHQFVNEDVSDVESGVCIDDDTAINTYATTTSEIPQYPVHSNNNPNKQGETSYSESRIERDDVNVVSLTVATSPPATTEESDPSCSVDSNKSTTSSGFCSTTTDPAYACLSTNIITQAMNTNVTYDGSFNTLAISQREEKSAVTSLQKYNAIPSITLSQTAATTTNNNNNNNNNNNIIFNNASSEKIEKPCSLNLNLAVNLSDQSPVSPSFRSYSDTVKGVSEHLATLFVDDANISSRRSSNTSQFDGCSTVSQIVHTILPSPISDNKLLGVGIINSPLIHSATSSKRSSTKAKQGVSDIESIIIGDPKSGNGDIRDNSISDGNRINSTYITVMESEDIANNNNDSGVTDTGTTPLSPCGTRIQDTDTAQQQSSLVSYADMLKKKMEV